VGVVTIGVDIGQRVDPTAICVAEQEERARHTEGAVEDSGPCRHTDDHYVIRYLERLALGTPYPQVGRRVAEIAHGVVTRTRAYPMLYLDATGVGTPMVDALEEAGIEASLRAVYFTHGDRITKAENGEIRLGKAYLVSRLQALLQSERLHLPKTAEAQQLAKELLDYEIKIDQHANDLYGAFRVGTHDDLVTALGLAVHAPYAGRTEIW
jgi:hypothetical protein